MGIVWDSVGATTNEKYLDNRLAKLGELYDRLEKVTGTISEQHGRLMKVAEELIESQKDKLDPEVVAMQLSEIRIQLFGDTEMKAKYDEAKRTGTWPSHPAKFVDPPPGIIQELRLTIDQMKRVQHDTSTLAQGLDKRLSGVMPDIQKLLGALGPLLEQMPKAPLDGQQVATKDYVDRAVERIARALRGEFELVPNIVAAFQALRRSKGGLDVTVTAISGYIAAASAWAHDQIEEAHRQALADEDRRNRPSRLESLFYGLTGRGRS